MNKIYKVIWNAALQCWVAVSELGKAKGKTKSKKVLSAAAVMAVSAVGVSTNVEAAVNYATGTTFGGGMAIGSRSYANINATAYGHEANARALEDVAIGYKTISGAAVSGSTSHSSAQASVAVGTYANATHVATTAIGAHASAINNFATAVGAGALANKENGSAFGQGAMATGVYATALGKGALAKQDYSVALGKEAAANTQLTTSIGSKTNATGFSAIAIGSGHVPATGTVVIEDIQGAQATADDSMAVGASALANKEGATALGKLSKATNNNAVAVGPDSVASGSWATATGASANASGQASAAFGESARAGGKKSIATGSHASASGENAIASGANAIATKNGATAVGANTEASGDKATALGDLAKAKNNRATALGHDSQATGEFSTAVGVSSRASGVASVATGKNATASGSNAIATGNASNAAGADSIASGRQASATGTGAVATGAEASASGNAAAYGNQAKATGGWSSAFGNEAKATQSDASAFGNSANASTQGATAVGAHSSVTASGGVALGNGAVANRAARDRNTIVINTADPSKTTGLSDNNNGGDANTVYAPVRLVDTPGALNAIKNTINGNKGAVSVGDSGNTRQIINVAAGSADSDAVNVAQLKAVAGAIKKYSVTSPDGSITVTNPTPGSDPQNFQIKMNTTAVQNAAQWYVKEGTETSGTAVRGGNTVSFNDSSTVDVQHNNKNFTFNVKSGDVTANTNTGAITAPTDGNVLAKAKNVAEAIQRSGWELQANGTKVGLVNPGDTVNIASGNGITVTPTTESRGVSKVTINAKVAGIKAGNNVTVSEAGGVYTINANDTNTQASVEAEGSFVNVKNTARNTSNNTVKYQVSVTTNDVSMNTATGATNQATATGLTTNKAVADAIAKSGFQLKENGKLKNVVNPGESLNFKPGQGTTVSVGTNGDVQVNANVADIRAGNNVTVTKGNNGVVTINANDTNTQASVANGTGLTLTESNNSNGTKKYTLGVNVDNNTIKVENGKLVANLSNVVDTNTQSTVEAKANNFVTVDGSTKNTNGTTKYQVGVTTGDVAVTEATGAVTAISAATGVATNKTVADAIAKSGFQLQENGTLRNVVNPGEILNFKPGKGTTVSVGKNGDVQINANVAGITAGKNITTNTDTNGNVTINAKDTSAHVQAANNAAVKVDKAATTRTENNADITDYTVDLTDQTKTNITHGVNANETVTNKGLTFNGNTGSTGIKKLGSEVDVKGNTSNNVITTTANTNGITVDYNGTAAAQVTSLTYKANNANAKSVTLAKGLDFTNGTQTTAEVGDNGVVKFNVNTTTLSNATANGNIQVPTGANSDGLVTAKNVANAINTSGWNLQANNVSVGLINPSDKVSFDAGNGVTVTSTNEANGVSHIKVAAKVDGSTITVNDQGQLVANLSGAVNTQASVVNATSSPITIATTQNTNGTNNYTVDVNVDGKTITKEGGVLKAVIPSVETVTLTVNTTGNNAGKVEAPTTEADKKKLVTAENVAKAINESYWVAKRGDSVTTNADSGDGDSNVAAGNNVTFVAGKNMALQKAGNKFIYATKDDVTFNNVTANNTTTTNLTVNKGGNVDMGGNQVHNVSTGTAPTDAVNVKQLYDTVSGNVSTESVIKKADEDNIAEVSPKAGQTVGDKNATYEVSVSKAKIKALANETVKVNTSTAANNPITVTPHTENGNTTYTVNFDGVKAAAEIPLTYKANDGTGKTVKLSEGLNFKNGTQTTAEVGDNGVVKFNVNTTTLSNTTANGKITVPDGNGLVTAKEVANAINAANWKLNVNGDNKQSVSAGDIVNFADGNGTTVTYKDGAVRVNANVTDVVSANGNATITRDPNTGIVTVNAKDTNTQASVKNGSGITVTPSTNANGTANYTVAVNVDGSTITVNNDGKLVANVPDTSKVSLTNNAGKVGDVSTGDANKFVTGDNLAKTINATYWKASQGTHEENTSEETTGVASSEIKPGDELTFVSGKNMALKKNGNKFVYATKDDVVFNNVTANNTTTTNFTVKNGGNVDMGGNQVHNVSTGTAPTDAVNVKQLYDTVSGNVSTESVIKKADEDNIAEVSPKAGQTVGDKNATYEVSVSKAKIKALANETVKVNTSTAANNPITVTPHTENGNTTYTVNFDGVKAAAEIPLTYKANDGTGKTVKLSEGLNFKNGTQTTAEVGDNGVVKFNVNTTTLSNTTANGKITVPDGNGLVTAKEVAEAINASYWKANAGGNVDGATVTDNVTTGTEVFFAAGKNLKVKHSANNFTFSTADDVSFNNVTTNNLTVNAKGNVDMGGNQVHNVANGTKGTDAVNLDQLNATTATAKTEVKAGKNVSSVNESKDAKDGHTVYTIDAVDTSAHVKAAESNAAVKVEKAVTTRTDGNTTVTDYTVDLTDETKANITHGVNANTTVTTKGLTFNGNEGTTGIKKLGSEVDVKGGTANNVITTNATEAGITINYNGTEAAKVTHLTYKANGANAQSVNLTTGLDFTNGTQTTAEVAANGVVKFNVNTTALSNVTNNGKITVPEGNGLVTAKEVAEAINASYWKANAGGNVDGATVTDNVTTGTEVFFAAGKNLKVKHSANNFTFSTADDVSFNNVTTNNLTVNAKGNVDMGGNQVHNVANGTKGTDAVNLDQLNATTATANAGWVIKANGTNATTVKPNATVSLNNTDGNILITKNKTDNNVTFNFNPNATFGVVGKDGKDGVDGSIGVNGKDGASVVIDGKNGSIGLTGPKGKDGKDGVSLTLKPEKGTTTVNAKDDGKEIERIKYTANGTTREVATLDDGLKFAGDDNKTINRTLGSLLNITGGATDSTTANNIRVTNDGKNGLRVQLANNVTFDANGSVKIGNTTVNNGGLTINGGPSITKDSGVNAGNKAISNVSTGVKDNDAVNVKQLKDSVSTESVVAKTGTDNIAEVSPKAGQTLGDKNAQYEVSVSKAKVKDAAVEAVKVNATTGSPITVTTTADAANNSTTYTVNFNGDNAAKEIPLTYKSNGNASTAKTVKLSDGLDFTNGTLTTAVVGDNGVVKFNVNQGAFNTTTADANGKLNNASKEGVSTVEDVIKAVNAAGWVVTSGNTSTGTVSGTSREVINPGDAVKFIAGQNVDITQDKGNFTIATRENVSFTTVTVGKDGKNGKDGLIGVNGTDGASVVINGKDGSIGLTGPKGKDGVSITLKPEKGTTTVNATDAGKEIDRIKYTDTNGTTREVATLDDGLKFKGDSSQVINRTLGSQMNITGGADETTLTDNNIGVVYDKATDGLKVKLAKDVNLTTNGSVVIGNTTLNNNGFTITNKADPSKTVSVTDKGLNNGGNTIINVAPGVNGTDAVNLDQLNATTAIANAGWVIKANGTNATTVKPNATVSLNNTDGNILITKNKTDNNVTFNFNPNATFGVVGKDGKDGVDGSIGVNGKDGSSVVINGKDGSIGLNGKDGKNGLSIKGDQGPAGVDGKDGETKTRIVYEYADPKDPNKTIRENVATLNDGLRFTGNNGVENAHRLNTLVTIVGEGVDKAASANFTSASGNINVKADGKGTLEVQLAKNLKNIETINNGNSTITLNKDGGTTISGGDVSVDGNKVTNVKDGDVSANSKDAVNGSQLYHVMTNATAGWNLSVNNGKDKGNVKPGAQVDLNNTDGNIIISKTANNVTFNFNPNATFGVKGKDGKDGVDGSIGVNGKDGASVVINGKDGSIGLTGPKGADGKDGASANMSVQKGTTTVNTDRDGGKDVTRIVYTDKDKDGKDIKREVATLDDGLKFKGDSEQVINRTLGSQMNITGGADSTKLTDNNIGVVYDEATNGLKVKLSKDVDLGKDGSITIGGTQVTNNGLTIKNGPSVTEKGVDAGNKKVTNVADGDINETSKDAVNGSQLYQAVNNINKNVNAAKTELEEGDNVTITSRVGNNGQTIYKVSSTDNSAHVQGGSDAVSVTKAETTRKDGSTTVTDYTVDLSSKTKDDIKKGVDAHDTVTNKGLTFNADKGTTGAKKLGSQVAVNGDNKNIETVADTNGVKVKLKDDINVNSVTANTFKAGDTIVNTKGVQVAAKDDRGNNTNVVINEKGINAGNTRIQNVAAGRADTDAVNVSQLKGAVTQIGNHINKMDKNLRAGIAGAMAAGGLYHATLPGKSMVAAGAGTYKGESAVAVGYSRLSDNGKVGIKFSVNTNTRGDAGAAASVGYQW